MLSFKFFFGKYFQEDIFHVHNNFSVKVNFVNYRDCSRRELTTAANTRQILAAVAAPNGGDKWLSLTATGTIVEKLH